MKKLFTTLLMMGVALCGWATITETSSGTTVTLNYVDDGNSDDQNFSLSNTNATTIVLTGDWANKNLQKIGTIVGRCSGNVFLDLSACTKMVSSVNYTGEGDIDWTSNNFVFMPNPNYPETVTVTGKGKVVYKYYESWGVEYTGGQTLEQHDDGLWYEPNTNWNGKTRKEVNVDENGNELPENATITNIDNGIFDYSYTYTLDSTPFSLAGNDFSNNAGKLSGIAFPNHANFNYIPADLCSSSALAGLENVEFGDYVQWIGENAFANKANLNDVTFPESLAVIGIDAFYGCSNFYTVNLDLPNLVRVDASAFNMGTVSDEKNNVREVILPSSTNTTLKFWGNQVFSSSNVTSLDFSHCEGIKHFAYDGYQSFGHDQVHQGQTANSIMTFYYHTKLQYISFPPNLLYVGKECFGKCNALQTAIFNGRADYNKATCPATNELKNPLIIDEQAFKDIAALTSVTLSDNITEIRKEAFQATGLTEIRIPASVQVIGVHAFQESKSLKVVYFDDVAEDCAPCKHAKTVIAGEHRVQATDDAGEPLFEEDGVTPVYEYTNQQATDPYTGEPLFEEDGVTPIFEIKREGDGDGAFFHCPVTDVYINCPGANIICENKAFDYNVTFGQTDPKAHFGTLHYPAGEEEHYVNLSHYLTNEIANTPGLFQSWLQAHFNWATKPNNNGWHEFINSSPQDVNDDPPYEESGDFFLRTYSDPSYARIVPTGIKAYIVKNIAKNGDNFELTLQQLRVIPAQTGVILFGQPNANAQGGSSIAMTAVAYAPGEGQPLRRDYWDTLPTELTQQQKQDLGENAEPDAVRMKNYLMPIIPNAQIRNPETEETSETNLLKLRPYEKVGGAVTFRNFVLGHIKNTENLSKLDEVAEAITGGQNYAAFFRVVAGTKTSGYAYLHLDPTEYASPSGAECVVIKDDYYTYEYNDGAFVDFGPKTSVEANPNRYWQYAKWEEKTKLWGDRSKFNIPTGKQAVQFLGELEDEVDGIAKLVVPATENGEYYTLQGVKVTNPTKGVYIHNGQKVIIK